MSGSLRCALNAGVRRAWSGSERAAGCRLDRFSCAGVFSEGRPGARPHACLLADHKFRDRAVLPRSNAGGRTWPGPTPSNGLCTWRIIGFRKVLDQTARGRASRLRGGAYGARRHGAGRASRLLGAAPGSSSRSTSGKTTWQAHSSVSFPKGSARLAGLIITHVNL